jgi:hypothetical protein
MPATRQFTSRTPLKGLLSCGIVFGACLSGPAEEPPAVSRKVDFEKDVQPIFRERCFECHSTGNEEGGLNLGVKARTLKGGQSGTVIQPGQSAKSLLFQRVAGMKEGEIMPPEGEPLSPEQVGIIRAWIDQGATWPQETDVLDARTEQARKHWAFQPLDHLETPKPAAGWSQTPIDSFILKSLQSKHLTPSETISPRSFIRRVTMDLVGLPPTPEDITEFEASCKADLDAAVSALVDQLLASPHYGERWGRHWLDVARYADSNGQEGDQDRPGAYHYRDFVIRAFNEDLPYDQFVRWQIAGDELDPENPHALAATGFLVAGPNTVLEDTFLEEERLRNRYNELDDLVSTLGTAFLGLTVGCARCHDHKYDAISARDYYQILAAFHGGDRKAVKLSTGEEALVFADFGPEPRPTWLFDRADFYDRDEPVSLGFPAILIHDKSTEDYWKEARPSASPLESTYQRAALSHWITDTDHGAGALLARVIVNRVWQHHFGTGLVSTGSDFGVRGETPSHPELLEWLAADFVQKGWKLKRLHRLILTSSVYQQSSAFDANKAAIDPENRLLWRMVPRRLEAEILRDAMLSVSGTLNPQTYGPAFKPLIPAEANVARSLKSPYPKDVKDSPDVRRRSVYMFHKRVVPYPLFQAFDRPDSLQSCGRREQTTVAPQALAILNDGFVRGCAEDFAERLLNEHANDSKQLIERAFRLALGRAPTETELAASTTFLESQTNRREARGSSASQQEAVSDFCQVMFGLNEFLYLD